MRRPRVAGAAAILASVLAAPLYAQSPENVLLVVNESSPQSIQIAEYYARKRAIPAGNILHLQTPASDDIDRAVYQRTIETPIAAWLMKNSAQDRILYIVLVKDIPLRVKGTSGRDGTVASVDSELTLLYRKMLGLAVPVAGRIDNPYFAGNAPAGSLPPLRRFAHNVADIYLVTRLAAYSVAEATALVDRALEPAASGKIVLDQKTVGFDRVGDQWLQRAADTLQALGAAGSVVLERTTTVAPHEDGVIGYYGWGSNDPAFRARRTGQGFIPGAIAATFVSSDGRTFQEPPAAWTPSGDWSTASRQFAGSPQSLAADLIREGVTGVAGHVTEPYLDATIRPYVLFPAYLSGLNLAEAYYAAMPYLSWQTVVVGDPLCAPFKSSETLTQANLAPPIDPETELPKLFSDRRVALMVTATHLSRAAVAATVKGDLRLARNDRVGARHSYEEAVKQDAGSVGALRSLAMIDEMEQKHDSAIQYYRRVLERAPNDVITLNNLAYALAVREQKLDEGLKLAERAVTLAPRDANVLDTLAWIYYLQGNSGKADQLLNQARLAGARSVDVWIHSAAVHLALEDAAAAQRDLAEALRLEPSAATRADVVKLQNDIKTKSR